MVLSVLIGLSRFYGIRLSNGQSGNVAQELTKPVSVLVYVV
jgi:hypothetical protein